MADTKVTFPSDGLKLAGVVRDLLHRVGRLLRISRHARDFAHGEPSLGAETPDSVRYGVAQFVNHLGSQVLAHF